MEDVSGLYCITLTEEDGTDRCSSNRNQHTEGDNQIHQWECDCQTGYGQCADSATNKYGVYDIIQRRNRTGNYGRHRILEQQTTDWLLAKGHWGLAG